MPYRMTYLLSSRIRGLVSDQRKTSAMVTCHVFQFRRRNFRLCRRTGRPNSKDKCDGHLPRVPVPPPELPPLPPDWPPEPPRPPPCPPEDPPPVPPPLC